jgi:hypothetical protein
MPVEAKTIQIFLPTGEPRGLRIADITTRTVQAIAVPRTRLEEFNARRESEQIGVYFLFGDREESVKPVVYIGQTEDLPGRLRYHNANREFWRTAAVVMSRTQSFTQAHIRYLEWLSIRTATEIGRFEIDNGNAGAKPFVTEPMEADVLDAFETMTVLLSTLGYPIFEPATGAGSEANRRQVFSCRGPLADGKGMMVDDGFVVLAGSLTRAEPVPSAEDFRPWLEELRNAGVLELVNHEQYRVTQDYVVSSPSYAASLVLARKSNGWQDWRLEDGRTLSDVYRTENSLSP